MKKLYFTSCLQSLFILTLAQQQTTSQKNVGYVESTPENSKQFLTGDHKLVKINAGDEILLNSAMFYEGQGTRPVLSNIIKTLGIAAATYQSGNIIAHGLKSDGTIQKSSALVPLGVGVTFAADKITTKRPQKIFLKYTFFDDQGNEIEREILEIIYKKINLNPSISRRAAQDGFVSIELVTLGLRNSPDILIIVNSSKTAEVKNENPENINRKKLFLEEEIIKSSLPFAELSNVPEHLEYLPIAIVTSKKTAIVTTPNVVSSIDDDLPIKNDPDIIVPNISLPVQVSKQEKKNDPPRNAGFSYTIPYFRLPKRNLLIGDSYDGDDILYTECDPAIIDPPNRPVVLQSYDWLKPVSVIGYRSRDFGNGGGGSGDSSGSSPYSSGNSGSYVDPNYPPCDATDPEAWCYQPAAPCNSDYTDGHVDSITSAQLANIFSNPDGKRDAMVDTFNTWKGLFHMDTNQRIAVFFGQVVGEVSSNFHELEEDWNYSAKRIVATWPGRFPTLVDAAPYAHSHDLFNWVYATQPGNTDPEDGFLYRGRGLTQLTGKRAYQDFTDWWNATFPNDQKDFVNNPDLVATDMNIATISGLWDFVINNNHGKNRNLADADNVSTITSRLTGGDVNVPGPYHDTNIQRIAAKDALRRILCP